MLGLDNPLHIAFVLVLLLLVFGAKRLPEMGKSMGSGLRGFKEAISGEDAPEHLTAGHDPVPVDEMHEAAPVSTAAHTEGPVETAQGERKPLQPVA